MKKPLLCVALGAAALLVGSAPAAHAQQLAKTGHWCATDEHTDALRKTFHNSVLEAERANAESLAQRMQQDDQLARTLRTNAVRIIPTVVHVVTKCGVQTISKAQILAGMQVLTQDWTHTNPDTSATRAVFKPYASTLDVEFRLAKIDPQGNSTDGIHRVSSTALSSVGGGDPVKTAVPYWPNYFNIWLVDNIDGGGGGGTILGYGQFPGTGPWSTWGFVMRSDCWTGAFGPNDRTASHEVGHCFNLYHTFQGGCGNACSNSGDMVCDTPPAAADTYGCNRSQNTCSNDAGSGSPYTSNVADQIENFMSYDACQNMFTSGQRLRSDAAFLAHSYLQTLSSPANQLAAGVVDNQPLPPPTPTAYMTSCQTSVCVGRPVTFTDASYGAPVVNRHWTFTNATPATDTVANPVVVFNAGGRQTVTLVAEGPGGTMSAPLSVTVDVVPIGQATPMQESFEMAGIDTIYKITSSSTVASVRRWKVAPNTDIPTLTASNGQKAFYLANGRIPAGTVSTLTSPSFDTRGLSATPQPKLKFDIAYSMRSPASADELRIYLSADCGRTWALRKTEIGSVLNTTGSQQIANFVPTSATQWRTDSIPLLGQFQNLPSLLFKFEATSQSSGNNLYLDNLRITATPLGTAQELANAGVALAPNPLTDETALSFSLARATRVAVRVSDVLGRPVLTDAEHTLQAGEHLVPLAERLHGRAAGVYVVTLTLDGKPYTQKLLVQ